MSAWIRSALGPLATLLVAFLGIGAAGLIAHGQFQERGKTIDKLESRVAVVEAKSTVDVAEANRHGEIEAKAERCCQATTVNKEAVEKLEKKIDGLAAEQRKTASAVGTLTAEVRAFLRAQRTHGP